MAKKKARRQLNKAVKRQKAKRKDSFLWKLDDGITYSSLSTWLDCPEQFSLKYMEGLTSRKISEPLEFGSIIHYALENQFKSSNPKEVITNVCTQYRTYRHKTLRNTRDKDVLDRLCNLAYVTFPQYCDYWRQDDKAIEWISREEKFSIPYDVPYPDGSTRRLNLRGMRDGIYRDSESLGVFETKTKSRISEEEILESLHCDMQTMIYVIATALQKKESVHHVKYNVIRRSGLKVRKGDTLTAWANRVEEDIMKRPEHYFQRFSIALTDQDISNFILKTLNPQLRLFLQWWDSVKNDPTKEGRFQSPYHQLNSKNLIGKYGKTDMWEALFGRKTSYTYRSQVFPELEESFQVTWNKSTIPGPRKRRRKAATI